MISTTRALIVASPQFGDYVTKETTRIGVDLSQQDIWYFSQSEQSAHAWKSQLARKAVTQRVKWVAWRLQVSLAIWTSELFLALYGRTVTVSAKAAGSMALGRSCSSCSEEKSPMVSNPDPKQYWNNWKNDIIVFCGQSGETFRASPTQLPWEGDWRWRFYSLRNERQFVITRHRIESSFSYHLSVHLT